AIDELVSVRPYALTKPTLGNSPNALRTRGSATFDPPYARFRNVGRSVGVCSRVVTMRSSIVGTTVAVVMPSSATNRTHCAGSNLVRYTIFRPAYKFDSAALTPAM